MVHGRPIKDFMLNKVLDLKACHHGTTLVVKPGIASSVAKKGHIAPNCPHYPSWPNSKGDKGKGQGNNSPNINDIRNQEGMDLGGSIGMITEEVDIKDYIKGNRFDIVTHEKKSRKITKTQRGHVHHERS